VDDSVEMATSLSMLLKMQGHVVAMAHDGATSLERSQAEDFDVILLDIGLPSVDGYEVARRIRSSRTESRPRLVGVSGYGFDADRRRALDGGLDVYLVKPVDPRIIENLLDQWSRRTAEGPPSSG